MTFYRQFKALGYKNVLLKVRNPISSCCEMLLPLLFILIMVGIYRAFNDENFPVRQFTDPENVKSVEPFTILPYRLDLLKQKLAIVTRSADELALANEFVADMTARHPALDGKTIGGGGFVNVELAKLRFPGFSEIIMRFSSEAELEAYITSDAYDRNWEADSMASPKIWGAIVFNKGTRAAGNVDYSIRLNVTQTPDTSGDKVNVLERGYSSSVITSYLQSKLQTTGPPFLREDGDQITIQPYPGFLTLQREVDRWLINKPIAGTPGSMQPGAPMNTTKMFAMAATAIIRSVPFKLAPAIFSEIGLMPPARIPAVYADLGGWMQTEMYAPQQVDFVPFPTAQYRQNGFYNLVLFILSFVLVIVLSLPASRLTRGLVLEKEMKIREGLRMMGMTDTAYYAAYMAYGSVFYAILALLITLFTRQTIFKSTGFGLVFLTFFLFGTATCSFCLLVATFFSKAKTAAALSTILFIGAYFPAFAVSPAYITLNAKRAASLLHCTAFGLGIDLIGKWEDSGAGLDMTNAAAILNNWSLNSTLGMLVLDTILYFVLAMYIDAVLPAKWREFGVPRPWYFPFTQSFWREAFGLPPLPPSLRSAAAAPAPASPDGFDSSFIEEPDANLKSKEREGRCVAVSKLRKEFSTPDGIKVAVDNVDLTMYEGQIFVLLGHNGAGKTTTISMLTGLIPPTSGTADIFGKKILDTTQMGAIRQELGVCPQHDVLWPELTVKEHLTIFADIKNIPTAKMALEITKAIADVGLTEKVNVQSSQLSGGQKRKLSVSIALCGGSKVIFLDEPTSGMDPYSRRSTWQVLQNAREGRVMVLTTHFMDEADILGDRIGIMAQGKVQCAGSPMFLKKRYGVGYVLTLMKGQGCSADAVVAMIRKHVPETSLATNVGAELSLRLPLTSSPAFPAMLTELDTCLNALCVVSYGISITSIEDVFLKISHGEGPMGHGVQASAPLAIEDGDVTKPAVNTKSPLSGLAPNPSSASLDSMKMGMEGSTVLVTPGQGVGLAAVRAAGRAEQSGLSTFVRHFLALMVKRWQYTIRDGKALLYQLFLPGILIAIGLALIRVGAPANFESYELATNQFNANGRVNVNVPVYPNYFPYFNYKAGFGTDASTVTDFFSTLSADPVTGVSVVPLSSSATIPDTYGFLTASASPVREYQLMSTYLLNDKASMAASKYGAALFVAEDRFIVKSAHTANDIFTNSNNAVSYTIMFNSTGKHTPAVFQNLINSQLLVKASGNAAAKITTRNFPLPRTERQLTLFAGLLVFTAAIIMIIAFSFVASSIALFVTREREVSAKHQQFISGVSVLAYWSANFVFDLIAFYIPAVIALILSAAFRIEEFTSADYSRRDALVLSFLLFGPALVSFTYVLTFSFKTASGASSAVLFAGVLCIILCVACQFMSQLQATCRAELYLRCIFRFIPTFAWGFNLLQLAFLANLPVIDATCDRYYDIVRPKSAYDPYNALALKANGTGLLFLALECVMYFGIVLVIEYVLSKPKLRQYFSRPIEVADPPAEIDQDVVAEAARVDEQVATAAVSDSVVVNHLRKVYPGGKVAVKNLSFGMPVGEVFGFLGINGAGKTTTLEILSGDILPTSGSASLAGFDILTQQPQVRRLLGYCPQFEALLEFLSVREHLQLYARIKGVPEVQVGAVVETKLQEMDLKMYENKLAGTLSGGNKRKLSVAIALIGGPPIVFLDEPSTGMDPVARRKMWSVISRVATESKQCSIILTTHSMEEVEALCTRIGIMVGGRLRCLGSSQHLRNRHGQGYQGEVKVSDPGAESIASVAATIIEAVGGGGITTLLPSQVGIVASALGNADRGAQVSDGGSGWAIYAAFQKSTAAGRAIPIAEFAAWWAVEQRARDVCDYICVTAFPGSLLLERNGSVMRFRILSQEPLARLFGKLEHARSLGVTGFTLGQTTLEQIFVQFAGQQEEETGTARGFTKPKTQAKSAPANAVADAPAPVNTVV